jgi:hypothetical protein
MSRLSDWIVTAQLLAVGLLATAAGAEELPFESELPSESVVRVELDNAIVEITIERDATPTLRGRAVGEDGGPLQLSLSGGEASVRIGRPEEERASRIAVELVLGASQPLELVGSDLELVINRTAEPEAADTGPSALAIATGEAGRATGQPETAAPVQIQLVGSQADLFGVENLSLVGEDSVLNIDRGIGGLSIQVQGGELAARSLQGAVRFAGVDSRCDLEDVQGSLEFDLQGGSLSIIAGTGSIRGQAEDADVVVDRWEGMGTFTGTRARYELRDSNHSQLKLSGTDTDFRLDGTTGAVTAKLAGGAFESSEGDGVLTIDAGGGSRLEVAEHRGTVALTLKEDSTAEVDTLEGVLRAQLDAAELDGYAIENAELAGSDARVAIEGLRKLGRFDIRNSEADLDLRELAVRKLDMTVRQGTSVTVSLSPPCLVQLRGVPDPLEQRLSVSGCEMQTQTGARGRWSGRQTRDMDGRPPMHMVAIVEEGADLRVVGSP